MWIASAEAASPLVPIARDMLQERVYLRIRQALILSEFKPGQVLTIRELAQRLGTSIMPVREALPKLTVDRVLELLPTRSVRVPVVLANDVGADRAALG